MHSTNISPVILSVSELNQQVRHFLETHIAPLWVSGEISNFSCPSSGHWYFTLKDAGAAIRCAAFQPRLRGMQVMPANGLQMHVRGRVSVYETRGDYQLIVEAIEVAGEGALRQAFETLKLQLANAGLFDAKHKKALPTLVKTVGVITSITGAALRDILIVLKRRFPLIQVIIYPTLVQGIEAAAQIATAIEIANRRQECDVLIVGRGGGSLEDLWPFNEEQTVRAIFTSNIPVISAVGHEIDFTLSDLVADVRAPTPSAAAELVSPDRQAIWQYLIERQQYLYQCIQKICQIQQLKLMQLTQRLRHPKQHLQQAIQKLDYLEQRLTQHIMSILKQKNWQLAELGRALHTVSPLATLDRGYVLLTQLDQKSIIHSVGQVGQGQQIIAKLKDGQLICEIQAIEN